MTKFKVGDKALSPQKPGISYVVTKVHPQRRMVTIRPDLDHMRDLTFTVRSAMLDVVA